MKLLDRYVIFETAQFLTLGTLAIVGIFFGTVEFKNIMDMLGQFAVPLQMVLTFNLLQLPTGLMYCLPAGLSVSIILVLIKMHRDSEMVALQAAGVSRARILLPFVILGVLTSLGSYAIGELIAPQSRYLSSRLLLVAMDNCTRPFPTRLSVEVRDENSTVRQTVVLGKGLDRTINGFLMFDLTQKEGIPLVWAQNARWDRGNWQLTTGRMFNLLLNNDAGVKGTFQRMTLPGSSTFRRAIESNNLDDLSMTTEKLKEQIAQYKREHSKDDPYLLLQYYRRFAHAANCLLMVLATFPVALLGRRENMGVAYVYCGLLTGGYFVLQAIFLALGENGRVDPLLCAWLPGVALCFIGLVIALAKRK